MNERTPGKPADTADQDEAVPAKSPTTEPPASAVRPSVSHLPVPTGDQAKVDPGETARGGDEPKAPPPADAASPKKKPPAVNLKAKDANDVRAPPPDLPTRLARLAKRDWHGMIMGWHMKKFGLTKGEAEDIFHDATVRALSTDDWPAEEKPTLSWLFKITRNTYYDHVRAERRRLKREVPLEDLDFAKENGAEEDAKDFVEYVALAVVKMPHLAASVGMITEVDVVGEEPKDVAAKNSISVKLAYERMSTAKAVLRSGWFKVSAGIAVGFAILLLLVRLQDDGDNKVSSGHIPIPKAEVPLLPLPPHPDPADLRVRALEFCRQKDYAWCLERLNHARRIDPQGDKDPKVSEAREEAEGKLGVRNKRVP